MMVLRRAKKTKFWDGQVDHPFFSILSRRIEDIGFAWEGAYFDAEVGLAKWRRPLFSGYELELSLMADDSRLPAGYFGFSPDLAVVSQRQTQVWNELCLWDCLNLMRPNISGPASEPLMILVTSMRWLLRAWHTPNGTPWPVPSWGKVSNEDAMSCANEFGTYLDMHLPRYLALISTPESLVHTMLNLETFPGKFDGNGPLSSCRSVFTAILLHDLGRTDEAIKELDLQRRQDEAAVQRGRDARYLEVTLCQNARLIQWTQGGAST